MMSRGSRALRCGQHYIALTVFTPHRYWPGWCLGLALDYQRSGLERQFTLTLGVIQIEVEIIDRARGDR